jgi:hypothetical protein
MSQLGRVGTLFVPTRQGFEAAWARKAVPTLRVASRIARAVDLAEVSY